SANKTPSDESQTNSADKTPSDESQTNSANKTPSDAKQVDVSLKKKPTLTDLQLRVKNNGDDGFCYVTRLVIPKKSIVTITYPSSSALQMAKSNFAQINGMFGYSRYEIEG
ncbi:hypothetical protein KTH44_21960, partial [Acinetobacter bereziniae]|uniref:hypothetical protein n=1 Tax=Acinetobacter bereziniae TaxID=106648 RepID=UPI0021CD6E5A